METRDLYLVLIGLLVGAMLSGFATAGSLEKRLHNQTDATIAFIEMVRESDSTLMDDVLIETDEWEKLREYLEY